MKITKINIKDYHQFKNFELDLTYPNGHEKAGQPLDKVCFIGQSGTGKTTLLNVIRAIVGQDLMEKHYIQPDMADIYAEALFGLVSEMGTWIKNGILEKWGAIVRKERGIGVLGYYADSCALIYFPAEIPTNLG